MDSGICTEANCDWLIQQGYDYLTIDRSKRDRPERDAEAILTTSQGSQVSAWRLEEDDDTVYLLLHSEAKALKDAAIVERQHKALEAELEALHAGLSLPRRMKGYDKVLQKIGRLKERYRSIQKHYDIEVDREGKLATAVRWQRNAHHEQASQRSGHYVLRSSRKSLDEQALVRLYWQLTEVEATFRSLKTELGMRPIFHQNDERIATHIWITVLAYYCVQTLRTQLKAKGHHACWASIRKQFGHRVRLTTLYPNDNQQLVGYRRDTPAFSRGGCFIEDAWHSCVFASL